MEKFCLDCESEKKCQIGSRRRRASADVVARAQALSPERRRRRPSVEVWGVGEKTPLLRGTRRCTGADIVARVHTLSPGRTRTSWPRCRRCRSDADVIARALKFGVLVKKHPSRAAPVVARVQTLSPARMRPRVGASIFAWAYTSSPERGCFAQVPTALVAQRRRRAGAGVVARAGPVCAGTLEGIKGPGFPSLLTFLPSEAS